MDPSTLKLIAFVLLILFVIGFRKLPSKEQLDQKWKRYYTKTGSALKQGDRIDSLERRVQKLERQLEQKGFKQ